MVKSVVYLFSVLARGHNQKRCFMFNYQIVAPVDCFGDSLTGQQACGLASRTDVVDVQNQKDHKQDFDNHNTKIWKI